MKKRYAFFLLSLLSLCGFSWPFSGLFYPTIKEPVGTTAWLQHELRALGSHAGNIDAQVLRLGLIAYLHAKHRGVTEKPFLTIIDFTKPANEKRLWVFDLRNGRALFNTWVSHGRNSGGRIATSFSNAPGSLKSSIGVFVTASPYIGGNGYSLRLKGLEPGINDNAYRRDIVIHGASYVNPATIRRYGQVGRSWGCPAVSTELSKPLINTIKGDTLLFAYYPDRSWLRHSRFLAS